MEVGYERVGEAIYGEEASDPVFAFSALIFILPSKIFKNNQL